MAPLPLVIQGLVQERRKVKALMKGAKGPADYQRLNIQQQVRVRGGVGALCFWSGGCLVC